MRHWILIVAIALLVAPRAAGAQTPVDVLDATPRSIGLEFETSSTLAGVGQTFGPLYPASWSVSGNTGTVTVSIATHEQARSGGGWTPVPGSFTPIVIEIDLTTLEATSQPASGAIGAGQVGISFTQNALDSTAFGGYMGPSVPAFFCTSQQQVDDVCVFAPQFCGEVCTIVPGNPYDPNTGHVNLIGTETQTGCDGGQCSGPFDFFTGNGDLRLTEVSQPPVVPALPWLAWLALAALLGGLAPRARAPR